MLRSARNDAFGFLLLSLLVAPLRAAEAPAFMEPGSLRFSHELSLEGVFHQLKPGWHEQDSGRTKSFEKTGDDDRPWKSEWGQKLLTEVATRVGEDIYGRVLFEVQGEYADRYWRPVNINNARDDDGQHFTLRQGEAKINRDTWYLHGFLGVGHPGWEGQGDLFRLYPESFPDSDYLGSSGYFGVYPQSWTQDQYLNISKRNVPRGGVAGFEWNGIETTAAYGNELSWGLEESVFGRVRVPVGQSKFTVVGKSEDVDFDILNDDEKREAVALSWLTPFEGGHKLDLGVLYQPYRAGERYQVNRDVAAGSGVGGSTHEISSKTSKKEDGLGAKARVEVKPTLGSRVLISALEVTYLDVLAGNKEQADFLIGTDIVQSLRFDVQYTYRRPVEGPIPFLYDGTPNNIGAIRANPRGPESPFTVDWTNREAVIVTNTIWFDPTPGSPMFNFDPHNLSGWNLNKEETSRFVVAAQHRMSDYRTTMDRQYYYTATGDLVWESAAHSGAWPTDGFIHEFRVLGQGKIRKAAYSLGIAGGQSPALLGSSYSLDPSNPKPITEYYSVEGRFELWPIALWGHYGTGIWGPEYNTHPFFGKSYDRLWGLGLSYSIGANTTWDIGYLAARQDDDLFVSPDLGSFDEIRTTFSHRFGFQLQFQEL